MRASTLLASAALLVGPVLGATPASARPLVFAQAMTGGAGSNSTTSAAAPNTEAAPGELENDAAGARRTSRDNGTSNPLAGDEQGKPRPDADPRPGGHAAGDHAMPHPSPGAQR